MSGKKLSDENLKEILDTLYPEYILSLQRRAGIIPVKNNPADLTPEEWQKILAVFSKEKNSNNEQSTKNKLNEESTEKKINQYDFGYKTKKSLREKLINIPEKWPKTREGSHFLMGFIFACVLFIIRGLNNGTMEGISFFLLLAILVFLQIYFFILLITWGKKPSLLNLREKKLSDKKTNAHEPEAQHVRAFTLTLEERQKITDMTSKEK